MIAVSNIAGTIDKAYDYKTDAVTTANREPGVAILCQNCLETTAVEEIGTAKYPSTLSPSGMT